MINILLEKNKFTKDSKFSFKDYVTFLCFNKGTSKEADFEDFIEDNFTANIQKITQQVFSKQQKLSIP